jgi:hypothetical protein
MPSEADSNTVALAVNPALAGPPFRLRETPPVNPVATLPWSSRAVTSTMAMAKPAVTVVGSVVKSRLAAAPAITSKLELVGGVPTPDADRVYPVPAESTAREENVAMPLLALTCVVLAPVKSAPAVPPASDIVTRPAKPVAVLP